MPPSWNVPDHVAIWIAKRLAVECEPFGMVKTVADAIGAAGPTISNIKNAVEKGKQPTVSRPMAEKLASYWGMAYEELERIASEAAPQSAVPQAEPQAAPVRLLRERPDWDESAKRARALLADEIPAAALDRLITKAGNFDDDEPGPVTASWVVKWVMLHYERSAKGSGAFPAVQPSPPASKVISKHEKKKDADG